MILRLAFAAMLASAAADENPPVPVPDGYVAQKLDATDVWIARPKDWFYSSQGQAGGRTWTISKEDLPRGDFQTGLQIFMIDDVRDAQTPTAAMVAKNFLAQESRKGTVLTQCAPSVAGGFERQCLETVEDVPKLGNTHYRFTAYWDPSDKSGRLFITVFSAPQDRWDAAAPIADTMSNMVIAGADSGKKKKE